MGYDFVHGLRLCQLTVPALMSFDQARKGARQCRTRRFAIHSPIGKPLSCPDLARCRSAPARIGSPFDSRQRVFRPRSVSGKHLLVRIGSSSLSLPLTQTRSLRPTSYWPSCSKPLISCAGKFSKRNLRFARSSPTLDTDFFLP